MSTQRRVFKRTNDDWYPPYRADPVGNLVEVSLLKLGPRTEKWRVCVWGRDDYGMERDFETYGEASVCFDMVIAQDFVDVKWLKQQEFVNA